MCTAEIHAGHNQNSRIAFAKYCTCVMMEIRKRKASKYSVMEMDSVVGNDLSFIVDKGGWAILEMAGGHSLNGQGEANTPGQSR